MDVFLVIFQNIQSNYSVKHQWETAASTFQSAKFLNFNRFFFHTAFLKYLNKDSKSNSFLRMGN